MAYQHVIAVISFSIFYSCFVLVTGMGLLLDRGPTNATVEVGGTVTLICDVSDNLNQACAVVPQEQTHVH